MRHMLNHHKHHVERLISSEDDLDAMGMGSFLGASSGEVDEKAVRPSAGGKADKIGFGLFAKNFYGADLKTNTFRIDLVITLAWKDARAIKQVPDDLERVVLSSAEAAKKVWMPEIVVTNREINAYNVISSEVQVFKSGQVEQVDRVQVRASNNFEMNNYPFDVQDFRVKIASSKYMAEDLVLTPMTTNGSSGLNDNLFAGTSYKTHKWSTLVYEERDSNLVKSRGMLEIVVNRNLDKYTQDHLVPTGIALMISWAVFYFPFAQPFITPRLCLSIITLLTFTNLMIKSSSLLPGAAPFNWNDLFNQFIQTLMFLTIVLNIASEICFHQFQVENLARKINHEAKVLAPAFSLGMIAIILSLGSQDIMSLNNATLLTHSMIIVILGIYAFWCVMRFRAESAQNRRKSQFESQRGFGDQDVAGAGDVGDAGGF